MSAVLLSSTYKKQEDPKMYQMQLQRAQSPKYSPLRLTQRSKLEVINLQDKSEQKVQKEIVRKRPMTPLQIGFETYGREIEQSISQRSGSYRPMSPMKNSSYQSNQLVSNQQKAQEEEAEVKRQFARIAADIQQNQQACKNAISSANVPLKKVGYLFYLTQNLEAFDITSEDAIQALTALISKEKQLNNIYTQIMSDLIQIENKCAQIPAPLQQKQQLTNQHRQNAFFIVIDQQQSNQLFKTALNKQITENKTRIIQLQIFANETKDLKTEQKLNKIVNERRRFQNKINLCKNAEELNNLTDEFKGKFDVE
ncbi:Hypothetical_protein [Hexamita inflata]|uniref:Hypothetical_protein n=1 Tax=Hexamita inflata TaxID=28002 RepID=A0AA86NIJ4_9EUKA|nr:Hypothetical protein HINF_LOCUS7266 [Hexamita inflata]